VASEIDSPWHRRARPVGAYRSIAWVPGNFLAEGTLIVGAAISTLDPVTVHVHEREAVAFQVVDSLEGTSARGDYAGHFPGVVRPLLKWESEDRLSATEAHLAESRT
jgi:lipopolysaccharide transport system ATP-binding protein